MTGRGIVEQLTLGQSEREDPTPAPAGRIDADTGIIADDRQAGVHRTGQEGFERPDLGLEPEFAEARGDRLDDRAVTVASRHVGLGSHRVVPRSKRPGRRAVRDLGRWGGGRLAHE